jgi:superfamily II DNA helicase RecQ
MHRPSIIYEIVFHRVGFGGENGRLETAAELMMGWFDQGCKMGILFCATIAHVDEALAFFKDHVILKDLGIEKYHGKLSIDERRRVHLECLEGRVRILVCVFY